MTVTAVNNRSARRLFFLTIVVAMSIIGVIHLLPAVTESASAGTGSSPVSKPVAPMMPEPEPFSDELPAKGKFLVARRNLADPRFQESVVLLIEYGAGGAAGIIINKPTKVPLSELFPSVPGPKDRPDVVYYGGPVEGHRLLMLVRSAERPEESRRVFGNVYVSASRNALERLMGSRKTEKQVRVYAGYAGWGARQLDREIARGDWLITSADAGSIFEKEPSKIWRDLYGRGSAIQVWNRPCNLPFFNTATFSHAD